MNPQFPLVRIAALAWAFLACLGPGRLEGRFPDIGVARVPVFSPSAPGSPSISQLQKLDPYDSLLLRCPSHAAIQTSFTLSSLGMAELPWGKRLVLAGLSLDAAEQRVRALYEAQTGSTLGDLRLVRIANPKSPIRLTGELKRSGTFFPTKGRKLSVLLALAQPTDMADLATVEIRSGEEIMTVDTSKADPELKGGDKVFVPRLGRVRQVFVLGAVAKPGAIEFVAGLTAKRAVELAGGPSGPGDLSQVRVDRDGRPLGTLDFAFGDAPLQVGDTVTVPYRQDAPSVMVFGGAFRPGRVYFRDGLTLRQAIEAAGGARLSKGKITLLRIENGRRTTKTFELAAVRSGQLPDFILMPGDRIELPEVPA